ncbi:hypothetical protein R1sor_016788 [Riccia sorocarpa]|uniref:Uncharacterized protein n=1 Tax=Riccia sorocarpa TaxID=122646 RepID=A0ABD3HJB4_9MARC
MEASISSCSRGISAKSLGSVGSSLLQGQGRTSYLQLPVACPSFGNSVLLRSSIWGSRRSVLLKTKDGNISLLLNSTEESKELKLDNVRSRRSAGVARSYMENENPVFQFLNRVQGSLRVVSLVARILNPEGGIGNDRIRLDEFITRVEKRSSRDAARSFYEFSERHGKVAKSQFVLLWCWAAAVGAGLLRSDDLVLGAKRLRVSYDLAFEVENFEAIMDEALKKREKSGSPVPYVPIELRAEKALEAILQCCTGSQVVKEEDAPLLATILKNVFPTADAGQIDLSIQSRMFEASDTSSMIQSSSDTGEGIEEEKVEYLGENGSSDTAQGSEEEKVEYLGENGPSDTAQSTEEEKLEYLGENGSSDTAEGNEEEKLEYLGELRVPEAWVEPEVAAKQAEWLRVALHQWLDDEFCPEPANEEISKRCSKVFYYCLLEQQLDVGDILMQMVSGLETVSFKESFHGAFSSANAAIDLITRRMRSLAAEENGSTENVPDNVGGNPGQSR